MNLFNSVKEACLFILCQGKIFWLDFQEYKDNWTEYGMYGPSKILLWQMVFFIIRQLQQNEVMTSYNNGEVLPRCGAWYSGIISMKQVSLNDVRRHILAANYIKKNKKQEMLCDILTVIHNK